MSYGYDWDVSDVLLWFTTVLFVVGAVALIGGIVVDVHYSRASFAAQAECRAKRMEPMRKSFSSDVACFPSVTRQDTTTVQVRTP